MYSRVALIGLDLSTGMKMPTLELVEIWPILKVVFPDSGLPKHMLIIRETFNRGNGLLILRGRPLNNNHRKSRCEPKLFRERASLRKADRILPGHFAVLGTDLSANVAKS